MSERQPTIVIIGAGEMGAAVGARLKLFGAQVRTSLAGRSAASVARVQRAGLEVVDEDRELIRGADYVLSIVPPGVALEVAENHREQLRAASGTPIFADCNAISPATAMRIGSVLGDAECRYVDAGTGDLRRPTRRRRDRASMLRASTPGNSPGFASSDSTSRCSTHRLAPPQA